MERGHHTLVTTGSSTGYSDCSFGNEDNFMNEDKEEDIGGEKSKASIESDWDSESNYGFYVRQ